MISGAAIQISVMLVSRTHPQYHQQHHYTHGRDQKEPARPDAPPGGIVIKEPTHEFHALAVTNSEPEIDPTIQAGGGRVQVLLVQRR